MVLNTDYRIFKIEFEWKSTDREFIFDSIRDLPHILKNYDLSGIKSLKEYDPSDHKFKRKSKKIFVKLAENECKETYRYLVDHYYFKEY